MACPSILGGGSPTLSSAQTQIVEIAKALSQDLRLLILDEPTAALTLTESARLFEVVRALARDGVSVIYVSRTGWRRSSSSATG